MSNHSVEYTGENTPTQGLVSTPLQAATQIMQGYLPANLRDMSVNNNFRDAVVGYILRDTTDHDTVLNTLCSALRGAADEIGVRILSEYAAAIAYSWEKKQITVDILKRNQPQNATTFLWNVAQAMHKQMPGPFYQTLLVGQLAQAESLWQETK